MMKTLRMDYPKLMQRFLAVLTVLGLFLFQAITWTKVSAQATNTPTPTETRFKVKGDGGYCGPDLARLILQLQYRVIRATQAVKGAVCGRLVIIQDFKTKKDYLGLVPCNRGGGPYIFQTRPRELLNYYQLVNARIRKGKTIVSAEFGEINQYITTFETYYPLDQCANCGSIPARILPPGFLLPSQTPSATPIPLSGSVQEPANSWLGNGMGYSASDMEFVFPTSSDFQDHSAEPAPFLTPETVQQIKSLPSPSPHLVSQEASAATATPTQTSKPAQASLSIGAGGSLENIKPPTDQPLISALGYSLYTLLLVPLIILGIIWRRSRSA